MESVALPFSLNEPIGRREFLKRTGVVLTAVTVAGSLSEVLAGCANATAPTITHGTTTVDVSTLTQDGQFSVDNAVKPDGTPILVVRQSAASFIALSMRCTHEGCQVNNPSGGKLFCACHGSSFDLQGNVLQGPASSPLMKYTTTLDSSTKTLKVDY